jgi:hypothetical protein
MRITIQTEGEDVTTEKAEPAAPSKQETPGAGAPPAEVAARAAAEGALSAGPAPAELGTEGTASFIATGPGTPETSPEPITAGEGDESAGAAPSFSANVPEIEVEEEDGEES